MTEGVKLKYHNNEVHQTITLLICVMLAQTDVIHIIVGGIHALHIMYVNNMTGYMGLVNMTKIFHKKGGQHCAIDRCMVTVGMCTMGLGYRVVFCNAQMKNNINSSKSQRPIYFECCNIYDDLKSVYYQPYPPTTASAR